MQKEAQQRSHSAQQGIFARRDGRRVRSALPTERGEGSAVLGNTEYLQITTYWEQILKRGGKGEKATRKVWTTE